MKRKLLNLIQGGLVAVMITGCASSAEEPDPAPVTPEVFKISVASKIANLQADTKEKKIRVTASSADWRAEVIDEKINNWITVTASTVPNESHVIIKTTVNDDIVSRIAEVRVVALNSNVADTIKVSQLGTNPDILLNVEKRIEIPAEAYELPLEITTNTSYNIEIASNDNWIKELIKGKAMVKYDHNFTVEQNSGLPRIGKISVRSKGIELEIVRQIEIVQGRAGGEIVVPKDKLFRPIEARASDSQKGNEAKYAIDDYVGSAWKSDPELNDPVANFPKWLDVDMSPEANILDYMTVYPFNGSGNWGKVDVMYNTRTSDTWIPIISVDFQQSKTASTIFFPKAVENAKTIRFSIVTGANNDASCSEVEFYQCDRENILNKSIDKVFKTKACMELNDNVQDADISTLPGVLQDVANGLRDGTYPKEFRMGKYVAHSSPEYWSDKLKTNKWGQADNPTGIWAKKGDKVIIMVGKTWGNQIKLFSCDAFVTAYGNDYTLKEGINEITVSNDGLFYVKYYVEDLKASNVKPIEVHILQGYGYVNGYWDLSVHKTDAEYERLYKMSTNPFRMFDIVGKYTHLIYSRGFIPETKIVDALAWYDKMCWWYGEVMGIDKLYNDGLINHRFVFISNDQGYMDASSYRTHYHQETLMERLVEPDMRASRGIMWGPAHEVGHLCQEVINFHGITEASNNFFSNLFYYKNNWGFKSRVPGGQDVIEAGFAQKNVKINVGTEAAPEFKTFPRTPFVLMTHVKPGNIFMLSLPYWQLYTYYHIAGKNPRFWPTYFELLRQAPSFGKDRAQENAMNNYILACDAAKEDLTDFFEHWGFFVPVDIAIEDYGFQSHILTQKMIDDAKAKVKAKGYKKAAPIEYIEDRDCADQEDVAEWSKGMGETGYWQSYRDNAKIRSTISVSLQNDLFTVSDYSGAAAFEFIDNDEVKVKSVKAAFTISKDLRTPTAKLYAVQVDGERVLIWPK